MHVRCFAEHQEYSALMDVITDNSKDQRMGMGSFRKPTVPHSEEQRLKRHARADGNNHTATPVPGHPLWRLETRG